MNHTYLSPGIEEAVKEAYTTASLISGDDATRRALTAAVLNYQAADNVVTRLDSLIAVMRET